MLNPVVGRQHERERLVEVLSRRTRPNALLLGEPGVGKTAVVEGLAQAIVDGQVPEWLRDRRIIALEPSLIVAGARDPGQLAERVRALVNEVRRARHTVLFLEGLDALAAGQPFGEVGDLLKPALARSVLACIGTATPAAYRAHIAPDAGLAECFHLLPVNPPSKEEAVAILRGLRDRYEAHYRVHIADEALAAVVELAEQHLRGRLPRAALDALDDACARARVRSWTPPPGICEQDPQIEELAQQIGAAVAEQDFEKAAHLRDQADKLKREAEVRIRQWREQARKREGAVDAAAVAAVVAERKLAEEVAGS
jgi:ATP-dependent Clp protease ATP-binding subunit ClpC